MSVLPTPICPREREFNADFLITYLVHPGTAIYAGYNSDLQNLNVVRATPGATGICDERQLRRSAT